MKETPCECCEGIEKITPETTANRPGLNALRYRLGTHPTFLETMLASLSGPSALTGLTTRETNDPAIALLDAGATLLDVLTFYQERIANEGFLRTATERRSILELARLVGYKLRPGVAASVYLAFTLENNFKPGDIPSIQATARGFDPEKSYRTEIPAGTRAQSIPHPGELPQAFETSESLMARTEWNTLQPRMSKPLYITQGNTVDMTHVYFKGTSTNLRPNDPLLLVFETDPAAQVLHWVDTVDANILEDKTTVTLQSVAAQTNATALNTLSDLVSRYLQLESFQVSATTQMARRVTGFLTQFQKQLVQGMSTAKLGFLINQLLPELREEHAIAIEGEYERLGPWVSRLIGELEAFETSLDLGSVLGTGSQSPSAGKNGGENTPLAGLSTLLPTLALPPSIQPVNAQNLARNFTAVFSPQADTLPRLFTAFQPKLKGMLYQAWAATQVTESTELQSANALRVKAAPFGHNAPLKVIQDDEGKIIGQEEWALESATVKIQLTATGSDQTLCESLSEDQVDFSLTVSQVQTILQSEPVPIVEPQTEYDVELGEGLSARVTVEFSEEIGTIEQITVELQGKKYQISNSDTDLNLSVDDQPVFGIPPGKTKTAFHTGLRITLDFSDPAQLIITVEYAPFPAIGMQKQVVTLDAEYNQILPGSWVVLERADWPTPQVFLVNAVKTISKVAYNLTGKVTQLTLNQPWLTENDLYLTTFRQTTLYAQSERLDLAEEPITAPIAGDNIELGALYDGLESGRWVIVSGERADIPGTSGVQASELVMLTGVTQGVSQVSLGEGEMIPLPGDATHTFLTLANPLAYTYNRATVKIYGNVVKATHGETRQEVLGSGNAGKPFQKFTLKQFPLTFISAATSTGLESTLEVRVNDVLWPEADSLLWLGDTEHGYETHADDNAKTSVIFGDGKHGARLPTGAENVKTTYRSGIGKAGNVAGEQISLLVTKPLGVKSVINPLPATGGADKETRDQARRNAPLAVMALDRLVSIQDYADFTRTFAGIGKATACELSDGLQMVVHVTVAGAEDIPIAKTSDLFLHLLQALQTHHGDPFQSVVLGVRHLKVLVIAAKVRLQPGYVWEIVESDIRVTLLDTFSFERRELEQDVTRSEVIATIQAVEGVAYVDLDILDAVDEDISLDKLEALSQTLDLKDRIRAYPARAKTGAIPYTLLPAQLAYLNPNIPDTLILTKLS